MCRSLNLSISLILEPLVIRVSIITKIGKRIERVTLAEASCPWAWTGPHMSSVITVPYTTHGPGPLTKYVKLRVAHAPGMPGTFSPPPRLSNPDMNHGTCVTHVPWCKPGSLTSTFLGSQWRESVPSIPGACPIRNFTYPVRGPSMRHAN